MSVLKLQAIMIATIIVAGIAGSIITDCVTTDEAAKDAELSRDAQFVEVENE